MTKIIFLTLLTLGLTTQAYAKKISYRFTTGEYNLKSHYVSYRWDTKTISASTSSDDYMDTNSLYFANQFEVSPTNSIDLGIRLSNENDINGLGLNVGYNYDIEWNDTFVSTIWADITYTTYFEQTSTSVTRRNQTLSSVAISTFSQTEFSFGLDQSITDWLFIGASYTKYKYSNDEVSKLDDGLSTTDSVFSNLDHTTMAYISLDIGSHITFEVSHSKTIANLEENNSTTKGLTAYFKLTSTFGLNTSVSEKEYTETKDRTYSVGLSWSFD